MSTRTAKPRIAEREPNIIGDASVVNRFLKAPKKKSAFPGDPLANHIHHLMQLHPALKKQFSSHNLAVMDEAAKNDLLAEINSLLEITPLKTRYTSISKSV